MLRRLLSLLIISTCCVFCASAQVSPKPKPTNKKPITKTKKTSEDKLANMEWSDAERDVFMKSCQSDMAWGKDSAQQYCSCMLSKIEKLYPNVADAGKLTSEKAVELAKECVMDIGMKPSWGEKERAEFMGQCVETAKKNVGEKKANSYCSCMMEKIEKQYPSPLDVANMKREQLDKWVKECNNQ